MNQTTTTATIDLAQLDEQALNQNLRNAVHELIGPGFRIRLASFDFMPVVRDALARRSLTSGAPADASHGAAAPSAEQAPAAIETEMADRLRRIVANHPGATIQVSAKTLAAAADECDRFYNGMMNWKANAQARDRTIIELREVSAGAAAKSELATCPYCKGKNGAHDYAYPHPSKDYSVSAAGAGSELPAIAELIDAANATVERWHSREWKQPHTRDFITRLAQAVGAARAALAQQGAAQARSESASVEVAVKSEGGQHG